MPEQNAHPGQEIIATDPARNVLVGALGLLLLALIAFYPAIHAGTIWDDQECVMANPLLKTPAGLGQIWTRPDLIPQGHYWPVVYTTFWIEYRLWATHPLGYHLDNILLQWIAGFLFWRVLRRMGLPTAASWLGAALFVVHPVNVESVAWITERKNLVSGIFFLLTVLFYVGFLQSAKRRDYVASLMLFVVALLSKSSTVPLPMALLILAWWWKKRLGPRDLVALVPFFVLTGAYTVFDLTLIHQKDIMDYDLTLLERGLLACRAICFYLGKLILPRPLMAIYPQWEIDAADPGAWAPVVILACLAFLAWAARGRWGYAPLAALAIFVVLISPVIGFIGFSFFNYTYVADRFQYLAAMSFFAMFAAVVTRAGRHRLMRFAMAGVIGLATITSFCTSRKYVDDEAYWLDCITGNPGSADAYGYLGSLYATQGRDGAAEFMLRKAIELNPTRPKPHFDLGSLAMARGDYDEAQREYETSLEFAPTDVKTLNNLGAVYIKFNRPQMALGCLKRALELEPRNTMTLYNCGCIEQSIGNYESAVGYMDQLLALEPSNADALRLRDACIQASGGAGRSR